MSGKRAFFAVMDGIAAIGVSITGYRVLPGLWETSIFDFLTVGGCLLLFGVMLIHKALTGEWPA